MPYVLPLRPLYLAAILLLFVVPCRLRAATALLTTEPPAMTMSVGGILYVSLPVTNESAMAFSAMTVTDISLRPTSRLSPAVLPLSEGTLIPGASAAVNAGFDTSGLPVGKRLLLTLRGTYQIGDETFGFSLNRFVAVPARPTLTLFNNPGDPLLLQAVTAQGAAIDYYGTKDAEGVPASLTSVRVSSAGGAATTILLDAGGRPAELFAPNGSVFQVAYLSPTLLSITAISADGSFQVNAGVDLSSVPPVGSEAAVGASVTHPPGAAAERARLGNPPLLVVEPDTQSASALSALPVLSAALGIPSASHAVSQSVVTVQRNGIPVAGADVYMVVGTATGGVFDLPGIPMGGGHYAVAIPHNVAPLPQPFHDIFEGTANALSAGCTGIDALGPGGPSYVCATIDSAAASVGPEGPEVSVLADGCDAAFGAADLYCKTVDYSPAPGMQTLADWIGQHLDGIIDRYNPSLYTLTATASLPGTALSETATQQAPSGGPFPDFTLNLGGGVTIDSFRLDPLNPAPYQGYTATAAISGANPNTLVQISIIGTDGYQNVQFFTISGSSRCVLYVPGTYAGDIDTVTVRVIGGPTTTAINVFGG